MSPMKVGVRVSLTFLLATGLLGCASTSDLTLDAQSRASLATESMLAEPACCTSFEELEYASISTTKRSVDFGVSQSPVFDFESGKSYFFAARRPPLDEGEYLVIRSALFNGGRNRIPTVLSPHVLFLDEQHAPIEPAQALPLCFFRGATTELVGYYGKLDAIPSAASYMVFFTDLSTIGQSLPYSSASTSAGGGAVIRMQVDYDFPKSPEGRMDVWVASDDSLPRRLKDTCWAG